MKSIILASLCLVLASNFQAQSDQTLQCRALSGDLEALREVVASLESRPTCGANFWYSMLGERGTDPDMVFVLELLTTGEETVEGYDLARRLLSQIKDQDKWRSDIARFSKRLLLWDQSNRTAALARSAFYREISNKTPSDAAEPNGETP